MEQEFLSPAAAAQYLVRRHQDLGKCRAALKENEFQVIETIGHNLKGNGASFGYPDLSTIGEKMENSAKEKNFFECSACVQLFEDFMQSI